MSRQFAQDGMELTFEDINRLQARMQQEFYDRIVFELIQRAENAFFGDSHRVIFASGTSVNVTAGIGFQTDNSVAASEPQKRLLYRAANASLNIAAPDTVNDRIDLVVAKWQLNEGEEETRKFKNATTQAISDVPLNTALEWETELLIVEGTPAGSPSAPAVPAGYIKLAEMLVEAVSGIADQAAITDSRTLMPLGNLSTINSSAFNILTQSAALSLQQAFTEVDANLLNLTPQTIDLPDLGTDPDPSDVDDARTIYNKGGILFARESDSEGGAIVPLGSGGGGGGAGANWIGTANEEEEFAQPIKKFTQGDSQKETLYVKVPNSFISGRQIQAVLGFYSPSSADNYRMQIVSTLIRKGQDALTTTANQETNNSGDILNDNANEYREGIINVSDATGQINGFAVSAGDLIKLELTRVGATGSEDSADVRFIPSATEIKFG